MLKFPKIELEDTWFDYFYYICSVLSQILITNQKQRL